jgi:hypothetical protein
LKLNEIIDSVIYHVANIVGIISIIGGIVGRDTEMANFGFIFILLAHLIEKVTKK